MENTFSASTFLRSPLTVVRVYELWTVVVLYRADRTGHSIPLPSRMQAKKHHQNTVSAEKNKKTNNELVKVQLLLLRLGWQWTGDKKIVRWAERQSAHTNVSISCASECAGGFMVHANCESMQCVSVCLNQFQEFEQWIECSFFSLSQLAVSCRVALRRVVCVSIAHWPRWMRCGNSVCAVLTFHLAPPFNSIHLLLSTCPRWCLIRSIPLWITTKVLRMPNGDTINSSSPQRRTKTILLIKFLHQHRGRFWPSHQDQFQWIENELKRHFVSSL